MASSKASPSADDHTEAPNMDDKKSFILTQLGKLMEKYTASGDFGRTIGYRRAIANIKCYKKPIIDV